MKRTITFTFRGPPPKKYLYPCRYDGCGWGPGENSARAKHERKKHGQLFTELPDPIHPGGGPSGSGLVIHGRDQASGLEYRVDVSLVIPRTLSPLVGNGLLDDQADEASGSEMTISSEPPHTSTESLSRP